MAQRNDMKKTWSTINDTLNRNKNKSQFPNKFIVENEEITNQQDISNKFNSFFSNIGLDLSSNIHIDDDSLKYTDYLKNPTEL